MLGLPAIVVDGATALAMVAFMNRLIASIPKPLRNDAVEADFFPPSAGAQPQTIKAAEVRLSGFYECHCERRGRAQQNGVND